MKYQIIIDKIDDHQYCAYCPAIAEFRASAGSADAALSLLQQQFLCFLHDTAAELEITEKPKAENRYQSPIA